MGARPDGVKNLPVSYRRAFVPNAAEQRNWMLSKKTDGGYRVPYGHIEDFPNLFRLLLCPQLC